MLVDIEPPECPANPMVSSPRFLASVSATIRSSELPDVDSAIAMSTGFEWAIT